MLRIIGLGLNNAELTYFVRVAYEIKNMMNRSGAASGQMGDATAHMQRAPGGGRVAYACTHHQCVISLFTSWRPS